MELPSPPDIINEKRRIQSQRSAKSPKMRMQHTIFNILEET